MLVFRRFIFQMNGCSSHGVISPLRFLFSSFLQKHRISKIYLTLKVASQKDDKREAHHDSWLGIRTYRAKCSISEVYGRAEIPTPPAGEETQGCKCVACTSVVTKPNMIWYILLTQKSDFCTSQACLLIPLFLSGVMNIQKCDLMVQKCFTTRYNTCIQ